MLFIRLKKTFSSCFYACHTTFLTGSFIKVPLNQNQTAQWYAFKIYRISRDTWDAVGRTAGIFFADCGSSSAGDGRHGRWPGPDRFPLSTQMDSIEQQFSVSSSWDCCKSTTKIPARSHQCLSCSLSWIFSRLTSRLLPFIVWSDL